MIHFSVVSGHHLMSNIKCGSWSKTSREPLNWCQINPQNPYWTKKIQRKLRETHKDMGRTCTDKKIKLRIEPRTLNLWDLHPNAQNNGGVMDLHLVWVVFLFWTMFCLQVLAPGSPCASRTLMNEGKIVFPLFCFLLPLYNFKWKMFNRYWIL